MRIISISKSDEPLLEKFLSNAGNSLESFRYFSKRKIDVIDQHKITILVIDQNENPVAYGHLDEEDETIWLGNCVIEKESGKRLGHLIMRILLNFARDNKIEKIKLSVDNNNLKAINLYEKFGFQLSDKKENFSFYEWQLKTNPEILISSLAFAGLPAEEIISLCEKENLSLEFSSGMSYREDMESQFEKCRTIKYAHNYFPAPAVPFVLNLASNNEEIRKKSIEHCINGIRLSYKSGAKFFSAHAGFCIDPSPEELGNPLERKKIENRES
ncbi:MAG: GNAT family N-acetyltransferase, partial [Bacteroidota bacterium]